ncbi:hypothetical protein A9C19_16365 [Bacillus weihaiensis]|uniref:Uncharacterized protein n=1 Tax=Bacillus weihaiensis TaxID=1547283 RepID=A0A1L3MV31_9BACI|nr:hypothetical protein A9C19_16365 [Bacillus weihaiensis]
MKIYDVSFKGGYQNEKYVSKVFKKKVRVALNKYGLEVRKGKKVRGFSRDLTIVLLPEFN